MRCRKRRCTNFRRKIPVALELKVCQNSTGDLVIGKFPAENTRCLPIVAAESNAWFPATVQGTLLPRLGCWRLLASLVIIPNLESRQPEGNSMGPLAWYELIALWGFTLLVIILDQKNLPK